MTGKVKSWGASLSCAVRLMVLQLIGPIYRQIRFRCGVGDLPGALQSGRSVRVRACGARGTRRARRAGAARGAVFGARGQNVYCVHVVNAAPVAGGRMATRRRAGVPSAD